jgi:hypothetical protein
MAEAEAAVVVVVVMRESIGKFGKSRGIRW